jgi:hypothetical protein
MSEHTGTFYSCKSMFEVRYAREVRQSMNASLSDYI